MRSTYLIYYAFRSARSPVVFEKSSFQPFMFSDSIVESVSVMPIPFAALHYSINEIQ